MTFRELEIFYRLSEDTNMSRVAKNLDISQSAISLSIKSLEKKLAEELFDRVGKKLILNERGREFKKITYRHYNLLKDAKDHFRKEKISGSLKVVGSRTIGDYVLPQVVFDFSRLYKDVSIISSIDNSKNIAQMVVNGDVNIGFIEANIYKDELISKKIGQDELVIVSSDRELSEEIYYIDKLFHKTWLIREEGSGTREMFLNQLGNLSYQIKNFLELSSFESIKSLLLNNTDTITCISKICVKNELLRGDLFEIKIKNLDFKRDFFMIYHKNKYKNTLFSTFKEFSKDYFIDN